jgi:hypothetical protein
MREPLVEKDAGVEALFWNVHVEDVFAGQDSQRILRHYVRLKIFDDKGKEKAATIDIEFGDKTGITGVAARVIKADGTILEMKKDAVFERDLVRAGGAKKRVKSFAVPGVEPGAIVEYRYTEIRDNPDLLYARLQLQREYPIAKVTYFVKPLPAEYSGGYRMSVWSFNCKVSPLKQERDDYESFSLENVAAFHEEPLMFGEPNVRPWLLLYYRHDEKRDPDKYWSEVGRKFYNELKSSLQVNDGLKQTVAEVTTGAKSDEEKVAVLIRYIRHNTRGFYDAGVTDADRAKAKMPKNRQRTSADVLKSGVGTADERNLLFAAMASSAGLDTRPALLPSRQDILFDPRMADSYFLDSVDMAVKIGDQWKIYDVSASHLPPGMLSWAEEGVPALLSDPKKPSFINSGIAPPEASQTSRRGKFTLSADGELEGDVDEIYTGHAAGDQRSEMDGESEARQQEIIKARIVAVYPQGAVDGIAVKNVEDATQPLTIHYHLKLTGYAARTSKRMLLQPLFFQRATAPLFSADTRLYPVNFHYAWEETDNVTITLPAGFKLENADEPAQFNFGKPGTYTTAIRQVGDNQLTATRHFVFGKEGSLIFDRTMYPQLKSVFDRIHGNDTGSVALTVTGGAQ